MGPLGLPRQALLEEPALSQVIGQELITPIPQPPTSAARSGGGERDAEGRPTFLALSYCLLQLFGPRGCVVSLCLHLSQLLTQGAGLGLKFILHPQQTGKGRTSAQTNTAPFPVSPPGIFTSLTRSRWALRSSCRKSRRASRTASGSKSGGVGEATGPGDGGWDRGLYSKGLGLLKPSPLPGREYM